MSMRSEQMPAYKFSKAGKVKQLRLGYERKLRRRSVEELLNAAISVRSIYHPMQVASHSIAICKSFSITYCSELISGVGCRIIVTGAWSPVAGSTNMADWGWYKSNDLTAGSQPITYSVWASGQPNNHGGDQHYIGLDGNDNYNYQDLSEDLDFGSSCFLCECP